jgi:tetratricopeptide (TPR) repeat protein
MQARAGIASTLLRLGDIDGALAHYRDMLKLNPNDNQGIRYVLAGCLLRQDNDSALKELLAAHEDGDASNSENLNLVSSQAVAAAYAVHWRERLAVSVRFDQREDWRRSRQPKQDRRKLMSERLPPSRLRRVTVSVPEDHAEDLRRFVRELRTRSPNRPTNAAPEWRRVSLSAELLIDPECQARGIIRDTRARGADRFHWSVLAPDQSHAVAAGRTGKITRGRWLAEVELRAFVEKWREQSGRQNGNV